MGFAFAYRTLPEFRAQITALQERVLGNKTAAPQKPQAPAAKAVEEALVLEDVRQFYVDNSKVGTLLVIEGFVVNHDQQPRKNIHVEGAILKQRQAIDTRVQKAGVRLSNTQLRAMTEAELLAALENEEEQAIANALQGAVDSHDDIPDVAALEVLRRLGQQLPQLPQLLVPGAQGALQGLDDPVVPDLSHPPASRPDLGRAFCCAHGLTPHRWRSGSPGRRR